MNVRILPIGGEVGTVIPKEAVEAYLSMDLLEQKDGKYYLLGHNFEVTLTDVP